MANQYSGRPATQLELLADENAILANNVARLESQVYELLAILTAVYTKWGNPDVARILLLHGVPVHDIDRELGRKTVYTTARNRDKLKDRLLNG